MEKIIIAPMVLTQSVLQLGKISFANLINLSKIESLDNSCISSDSCQQITTPCQTVTSQEECKLSNLLKWLTLPIIASSIALEGLPVSYQETSKFAALLKWLTLPILASTIAITCVPADYQETS